MPPATWTAWKIDAQGNRVEKTGDGSMPADPFSSATSGTTTVNGVPQTPGAAPPANSTPATPAASAPVAPTPPPPPPPSAPAPPPAAPAPAPAPAAPSPPAAAETTPPPPPPPPPSTPANTPSPPGANALPPSTGSGEISGASSTAATQTASEGSSGGGMSAAGVATLSTFLILFVAAAILGALYLRRRRSRRRATSVQAAFNIRRSFSAERAEMAGFSTSALIKSSASAKPPPPPRRHGNVTPAKIGTPVLIKATTDQEVLDTAIPAGMHNPELNASLMSQLGFETVPTSPRTSEFGSIPLGEMAESRTSSDHMRVRGHDRGPSFDFSKVDPHSSMGGKSSNYLVAAPQSAVAHDRRPRWDKGGAPFGSGRF